MAMQAMQSAKSTVIQFLIVIKATCSAKHSLTDAITAAQGSAPLPNLDVITWNHKPWIDTTNKWALPRGQLNVCVLLRIVGSQHRVLALLRASAIIFTMIHMLEESN